MGGGAVAHLAATPEPGVIVSRHPALQNTSLFLAVLPLFQNDT